MTASESDTQTQTISQFTFYAYWIGANMLAAIIAAIITVGFTFLFYITDALRDDMLFVAVLISFLIVFYWGLAFIQKWIMKAYTGRQLKGWVWATMIGVLLTFIFSTIFSVYFDRRLLDSGNHTLITMIQALTLLPAIGFPSMIQSLVLGRHAKGAHWYAVITILIAFLIPMSLVSQLWQLAIVFVLALLIAQVYTLIHLFDTVHSTS